MSLVSDSCITSLVTYSCITSLVIYSCITSLEYVTSDSCITSLVIYSNITWLVIKEYIRVTCDIFFYHDTLYILVTHDVDTYSCIASLVTWFWHHVTSYIYNVVTALITRIYNGLTSIIRIYNILTSIIRILLWSWRDYIRYSCNECHVITYSWIM